MLPTLMQADRWTRRGIEVTLLDPHRHLYYSGMMPEHLGGVYTEDEIRIDLQAMCEAVGVDHVLEAATALAPHRQTVTTASGTTLRYDVCALDVGGVNPRRPSGAVATKPIARLRGVERRIRDVLSTPAASLRLALVGGGAAGVETALNILGRFRAAGRARDLRLTILDAAPRLLASFPEGMSTYARHQIERRGATVHTNTRVRSTTDDGVVTDSGTIESDCVVWATGSVGPPFLRDSGLPTDDRGFLDVTPALRSPTDRRVFAAGDCATVRGHRTLRKVGVHAIKQGPVLRANLDQTLRALQATGRPPPASDVRVFRPYPIAPLILSTGSPVGLWSAGRAWVAHPLMLRLKHYIDRTWIRAYAPSWSSAPFRTLVANDAPEPTAL